MYLPPQFEQTDPAALRDLIWKMSQNRSAADRDGVVAGLRAEERPDTAWVADAVRDLGLA